jgi:hypothetical protein
MGSSLMELAQAKQDAETLVEIIGYAEIRLAVALASFEGDDEVQA